MAKALGLERSTARTLAARALVASRNQPEPA
jgi:hypothetical protein